MRGALFVDILTLWGQKPTSDDMLAFEPTGPSVDICTQTSEIQHGDVGLWTVPPSKPNIAVVDCGPFPQKTNACYEHRVAHNTFTTWKEGWWGWGAISDPCLLEF